jgi:hypothetical protein
VRNGIERIGVKKPVIRTGEVAVSGFFTKALERGGEVSVYRLPEYIVTMLAAALESTIIQEKLSTELTNLDQLIAVHTKEPLSGYIEVIFDENAGVANLFFAEGEQIESVFSSSPDSFRALPISTNDLVMMCAEHTTVFNVYQSGDIPVMVREVTHLEEPVPQKVVTLFEQILVCLEYSVDPVSKEGAFEKVLKLTLPQITKQYEFFDPFLGEFQYMQKSLSYKGEATYKTFVDGMCALINACLPSLYDVVPKNVLLPRISQRIESVSLAYAELMDRLHLRAGIPEIFQDYAMLKQVGLDGANHGKRTEKQLVLNLRGTEKPKIATDEILREFYQMIVLINEKYTTTDGRSILYMHLKESQDFQEYKAVTALLQRYDLNSLRSRTESLAFWINVYNFLVLNGILEFGVTTSVRDEKEFFTKTCYLIGRYMFSLDDIEHGILRDNTRNPNTLFRQFSGSDPRKVFGISPLESRIHCCLMRGTKSSPPLAVYMPDNLEEQWSELVNHFLTTQGMRIDLAKQELWLDRTFYWYRKDFEQQGATLMDFVIGAVQDEQTKQTLQENREKLKLRFMEYDWSLNGE